jgi:hypothetical protein
MLYELNDSSVICPYENVFFLESLSHIVYHPFQIMKNINGGIPSIQDIKNILKRKATWDESIEIV